MLGFGLGGLALALSLAGCAAGLCERKARFFRDTCSGAEVAYNVDPSCEKRIELCTPGQKAQMEGYVSCLEQAGQCSLEVMRACQDRYPGGVNLICG